MSKQVFLQGEVNAPRSNCIGKRAEIEELQNSLSQVFSEYSEVESDLQALIIENESLCQQVNSLTKQNETLLSEHASLSEQLEEAEHFIQVHRPMEASEVEPKQKLAKARGQPFISNDEDNNILKNRRRYSKFLSWTPSDYQLALDAMEGEMERLKRSWKEERAGMESQIEKYQKEVHDCQEIADQAVKKNQFLIKESAELKEKVELLEAVIAASPGYVSPSKPTTYNQSAPLSSRHRSMSFSSMMEMKRVMTKPGFTINAESADWDINDDKSVSSNYQDGEGGSVVGRSVGFLSACKSDRFPYTPEVLMYSPFARRTKRSDSMSSNESAHSPVSLGMFLNRSRAPTPLSDSASLPLPSRQSSAYNEDCNSSIQSEDLGRSGQEYNRDLKGEGKVPGIRSKRSSTGEDSQINFVIEEDKSFHVRQMEEDENEDDSPAWNISIDLKEDEHDFRGSGRDSAFEGPYHDRCRTANGCRNPESHHVDLNLSPRYLPDNSETELGENVSVQNLSQQKISIGAPTRSDLAKLLGISPNNRRDGKQLVKEPAVKQLCDSRRNDDTKNQSSNTSVSFVKRRFQIKKDDDETRDSNTGNKSNKKKEWRRRKGADLLGRTWHGSLSRNSNNRSSASPPSHFDIGSYIRRKATTDDKKGSRKQQDIAASTVGLSEQIRALEIESMMNSYKSLDSNNSITESNSMNFDESNFDLKGTRRNSFNARGA